MAAFCLAALCLAALLGAAGAEASETAAAELPFDLCLARELHLIPEADTWTPCEPTAFPDATQKLAKAWPAHARALKPYVTADVVRRLSRYAHREMAMYSKAPSLAPLSFRPRASHRDGAFITFAAQADPLPSHSPLVKRWLEIFVLYNVTGDAVERVTVTVRGQVEE